MTRVGPTSLGRVGSPDTAPRLSAQPHTASGQRGAGSASSVRMNMAAAGDPHHLPVADQGRFLDGTGDLRAPPNRAARRIDEQDFAADAANQHARSRCEGRGAGDRDDVERVTGRAVRGVDRDYPEPAVAREDEQRVAPPPPPPPPPPPAPGRPRPPRATRPALATSRPPR